MAAIGAQGHWELNSGLWSSWPGGRGGAGPWECLCPVSTFDDGTTLCPIWEAGSHYVNLVIFGWNAVKNLIYFPLHCMNAEVASISYPAPHNDSRERNIYHSPNDGKAFLIINQNWIILIWSLPEQCRHPANRTDLPLLSLTNVNIWKILWWHWSITNEKVGVVVCACNLGTSGRRSRGILGWQPAWTTFKPPF